MKLEYGKKYRDREGTVHGPLVENESVWADTHPYADPTSGYAWKENGSFRIPGYDAPHKFDLVEEAVGKLDPDAEVFITSTLPDTGARTDFETGAVRDASVGKGLPSCIPPQAIRRLAQRFEDGAAKYERNNWMRGIPLSRYQDGIQRHLLAAAEGQTDEDHLGAVLWNAAAWIWTEDEIAAGRLPTELDDLPFKGAVL